MSGLKWRQPVHRFLRLNLVSPLYGPIFPSLIRTSAAAPVVPISKTLPPSRTPTPAPSSIIKVKSKGREVQQLKDAEDASKTKSKVRL